MAKARKHRPTHVERKLRDPQPKTGKEAYKRHGWRLPVTYQLEVLQDDWPQNIYAPDEFDRTQFRARCCNPECEGEVINRQAAPWCRACGPLVSNEWKLWFWGAQWKSPKKALARLVRDVFGG